MLREKKKKNETVRYSEKFKKKRIRFVGGYGREQNTKKGNGLKTIWALSSFRPL